MGEILLPLLPGAVFPGFVDGIADGPLDVDSGISRKLFCQGGVKRLGDALGGVLGIHYDGLRHQPVSAVVGRKAQLPEGVAKLNLRGGDGLHGRPLFVLFFPTKIPWPWGKSQPRRN